MRAYIYVYCILSSEIKAHILHHHSPRVEEGGGRGGVIGAGRFMYLNNNTEQSFLDEYSKVLSFDSHPRLPMIRNNRRTMEK